MKFFKKLFSNRNEALLENSNTDISKHVAGIESVLIDNKKHYFGYSFSNDMVVTPLFSSAEKMANYAVGNLTQNDGDHQLKYWVERVREASEFGSQLRDEGYCITHDEMLKFSDDLRLVSDNRPDGEILLNPFISDIIFELGREEIDPLDFTGCIESFRRLGLDEEIQSEDVVELIENVHGTEYMADSALIIENFIILNLDKAEKGWKEIFGVLVGRI